MWDWTQGKPINPRGWLFAVTAFHSGLTAQLGGQLGSSGEVLALERALARSWEQPEKSPGDQKGLGTAVCGIQGSALPLLQHPIPQL